MHRNLGFCFSLLLVSVVLTMVGCFGGDNNDAGPVVPVELITLNGTLTAPGQLESSLLGNLLQNTDSQVRSAYQKAQVFVNGVPNALFSLSPLSSNPEWQFRIPGVAKAADGKYRIEVLVGKINMRSMVEPGEINSFRINPETTAALLLADATGRSTAELLASFPSFISTVENSFLDMCKLESDKLIGVVVQSATLTKVIQDQKTFFNELGNVNATGKLAYLQLSNDLDGDGTDDVRIVPNIENNRVRFLTALSSYTSILTDIASLSAYSNERLIQDFKENLTSDSRFFASDAANFALGLFFKKSAAADVYLKLFIRRIDLANGVFKGAVVEYEFVTTTTTAIVSGTKTLLLQGANAVEGAVAATNFVTDAEPGPYVLTFVSTDAGLGCSSGDTRLVRSIDGKPELINLSYAESYLDGGGNYHVTTREALKAIYKDRAIEVGDVFSAYFPNTKNYAIFKIKTINATSITIDYIVNSAENEARFK
ncbi:MAG: hypothetical protein AB1403_00305 [Candidatus Riflebacteria bacterium]